jgi:hypothetical protein
MKFRNEVYSKMAFGKRGKYGLWVAGDSESLLNERFQPVAVIPET